MEAGAWWLARYSHTSVKCNAKRAQNQSRAPFFGWCNWRRKKMNKQQQKRNEKKLVKHTRHAANTEMNFKMKICHIDDKKKSFSRSLSTFMVARRDFLSLFCYVCVWVRVYFILHSSTFTLLLFWLCIISFFSQNMWRLCAVSTRTRLKPREKRNSEKRHRHHHHHHHRHHHHHQQQQQRVPPLTLREQQQRGKRTTRE